MNSIVGAGLLVLLSTVLANVSNTGYALISSRSVVKLGGIIGRKFSDSGDGMDKDTDT